MPQQLPLISVIIPVYNVEKYLRECLDSVLTQTLTDIEIICVDDGSTDRSLEILNEYARKDERIRVISQKNKGPGAARNAGLQLAQGKYVYFMDSDDTIDPDLCRMTSIAAEYAECDILYFDAVAYDERCPIAAAAMISQPRFADVKSFFGLHQNPVSHPCLHCSWTPLKLFRTGFLQQNQILFSETLMRHEDLLFDWQCLLAGPKTGMLPVKLYFYRNRQQSLMQSSRWLNIYAFEAYDKIRNLLVSANQYEEFKNPFGLQKLNDFWHGYRLCHRSVRHAVKKQIIESLSEDDWVYVPLLKGQDRHFYESLRGNKTAKVLFWFDWNVRRPVRLFLSRIGAGIWYARFRAAVLKKFAAKSIKQNRELGEALVNLMEEIVEKRKTADIRPPDTGSRPAGY
ncbi:MAG: glycosyltransferase [Planctomycetaceae bacterium]|jgi:glycosyltransferase involved in cell wall biosynthesis|nr:glycosyltransferase [Planctomycetaceae bacterium]